jgi:uncharacterized protein YcbK (DUF882 family)
MRGGERGGRAGYARGLVSAATLLLTATALAQPPAHGHHLTATSASAPKAAVTATPAVAHAYLEGKQALVGLHSPATAAIPRDPGGRPMLALTTVNRHESLSVAAMGDDGGFASVDLDRVAHLLRASTGEEHPIDPRTLDLVYRIARHFEVAEIRVVSGYRVPRPGSHSNHGKGRAVDLIVPGTPDEDVARFARELGFVGVGVYPTSQFVHVDIRPRSYFWVDLSGPHTRNRERGILGDLATRSDAAAAARGQTPIEPFVIGFDVDALLASRGGAHAAPGGLPDDDEDDEN